MRCFVRILGRQPPSTVAAYCLLGACFALAGCATGASPTNTTDADTSAVLVSDAAAERSGKPLKPDGCVPKAKVPYNIDLSKCAVGCSCFAASEGCPNAGLCCGYSHSGCYCDADGIIRCADETELVCDWCNLGGGGSGGDASKDTAPLCAPAGLKVCWEYDKVATCTYNGPDASYKVTENCATGQFCYKGQCVANYAKEVQACPPADCAAVLGGAAKCLVGASGAGVCSAPCGICQGETCVILGVGSERTPTPYVCARAKAGDTSAHLFIPCKANDGCPAGFHCASLLAAKHLGPNIGGKNVQACVPNGW